MAVNLVGFDSAWADNARNAGSICAVRLAPGERPLFEAPRRAGFDAALAFIAALHRSGDVTLVAIDQPTIVPNAGGARPVERAVASLMSFSGGGIQPAFRGKEALFGDHAPIWRFLTALGFADDPLAANTAAAGGFVMEVFPALAVLALDDAFTAAARRGPRYNPARPTFCGEAWQAVLRATSAEAVRLGLAEVAAWCATLDATVRPAKRVQDSLDAVICLLVAARWRGDPGSCLMLGDLAHGYIVAPVSAATRGRLAAAAASCGLSLATNAA